jgi:hypothetical protein
MLRNDGAAEISDHDGKASILWNAFKERIGKSDKPTLHFNLQNIFAGMAIQDEYRDSLEAPFTVNEIVKKIPNDKSPGPDGFNNEFSKTGGHYWHRCENPDTRFL